MMSKFAAYGVCSGPLLAKLEVKGSVQMITLLKDASHKPASHVPKFSDW